jgi:WD40 repeat protein
LVSPDGRSLLVLLQEALHWYDVQTLSLTRRRGVRWSAFRRACYSPHGERIAVGHHDGTIEILRSDDAECVMVLRGHQAAIHDLTFIAQGRTLVSAGDDQTIRFWDAESGRSLGTLPTRRSFPVLFFDERRQRLLAMGPGSPVTAFSGPRDAENGGFPNARP